MVFVPNMWPTSCRTIWRPGEEQLFVSRHASANDFWSALFGCLVEKMGWPGLAAQRGKRARYGALMNKLLSWNCGLAVGILLSDLKGL